MRYCFVFISLCLFSCEKVTYYPEKALSGLQAAIAHRGGKTDAFRENTFEGSAAALKSNEGVEVDIQISKDGTLWLAHDVVVKNCSEEIGCFPETRDSEITAIMECNTTLPFYTRLEKLISYMAAEHPNKYLLVDLKGWIPCSGNSLGIEGMMRLEADELVRLGRKYQFLSHILLETDAPTVLHWARLQSPEIQTLLNVYGDLERGMLIALEWNLTGISYKMHVGDALTSDYIGLLHKKGLRISTWNLNNSEELAVLQQKGVDFIQYDIP